MILFRRLKNIKQLNFRLNFQKLQEVTVLNFSLAIEQRSFCRVLSFHKFNLSFPSKALLVSALAFIVSLYSPLATAAEQGAGMDVSRIIDNPDKSPNLNKERQILAHHDKLAQKINENYDKILIRKQPANKTDPCLIGTDSLNRYFNGNVLVFWEGNCANGLADGFGRVYVISGKRKVFELLANFHAEDPNFTTEYFSKDTQVENQTTFFYGKANRYRSSGINIIKNDLDNDLVVALEAIDKINWTTYLKEISKNSGYILNVKDLMNHRYLIHDLLNTPYKSMVMSYKLVNNNTGYNDSYSFLILTDGSTKTEINDGNNHAKDSPLPKDVVEYALNLNDEIEVSIEDSIKNVIEAMPVVNAYLNVICNPKYDNPVCRKMQCKNMCNLSSTITPNDEYVKQLLLKLVEHHNMRPLNSYLTTLINQLEQNNQVINNESPNRRELINSSLPNSNLDRLNDNYAPVDFSGEEHKSIRN